ncbi:glycoside hydrolase, partial [Streptomyces sp. T-3]|nr:glycoside hydrolase [Streptomyces sp. T-3]
MSRTASLPRHRKPRRNASTLALRAGVATGVLGAVTVTSAAASPAQAGADEPVTQTIEMPTLARSSAHQGAQSADATQRAALSLALRAEQDAATERAAQDAEQAKAEAERKQAEAERKERAKQQKAEAGRKAAAERR